MSPTFEVSVIEQVATTTDIINYMHWCIHQLTVKYQCRSVQYARAPANFYQNSLEWRRNYLQAPSTYHLCKTILLENTHYEETAHGAPAYHRYVIAMTQYEEKLSTQKLMVFMKNLHKKAAGEGDKKVSGQGFHFRLAPEEIAVELTGFVNNAMTPFFAKEGAARLPIILSSAISELKPAYMWMGGGRFDLKMGISVPEFIGFFGADRVHITDIVDNKKH